jgi:uncharacterized membrane protein YqgA involved in biofilm formation
MSNLYETEYWAERGVGSVARISAVTWAVGWIAFGMITGIGESLEPGDVIAHTFIPGFIFLITSVIAFRWECFGGILLLAEGIFLAAYYILPLNDVSLIEITFAAVSSALPALIIGSLFVMSWRKSRGCQPDQNPASHAA